ncbi:MAG: serine/threonine protein kinase [Polyangiaceae bacterium]|nr:serine/threonine protein kinase [Polyangiaceae bacterium]
MSMNSPGSEDLLHASVRPGDVLAGKYSVDRVIGSGGMGVVVVAVHVDLYERVALKFLLPEAMQSQEVVARFAREARAAFKLKSEHVARVIDVGSLESGVPFMVMEFLEGSDLDGVMESRGALPIPEAVEYILQACEAVAEAHTLGIIHRDLKPANLFLTRRRDGSPCIKVLDFGLSKVGVNVEPRRKGASMTGTRQMLGSPLYMPPEQMLASRDVDVRSDIWSLGAILFELLTNSPPFVGDNLPELQGRVLSGTPQKLRALRPEAPAGLEAVIEKCLQKERANRYANVAELAAALVPYGPMRCRVSAARIAKMIEASGQVVSMRAPPAFPDEGGGHAGAGAAPQGGGGGLMSELSALPQKIKGVLAGALVGGVLFGLVTGIAVSSCGDDGGAPPATTKPTKR